MSNIQTSSLRYSYIDACKAIGIILVILGHTYSIPGTLYNIIYSFHMPLFFIVSGFVYNESKYGEMPFKKYLFQKIKNYLLPYAAFGLINLILQIFWNVFIYRTSTSIDFVLHNLKGLVLCHADVQHMPNCSPIWFLIALFNASIIFYLLNKYAKRILGYISVFCIVLSYGVFLLQKFEIIQFFIPWCIPESIMAVFFMYFGTVLKKHNVFEKIQSNWKFIILLLLLLSLGIPTAIINGGNVGMNGNNYGNLLLFLPASLTLSFLVILLCSKYNFLQNKFFVWLGKNTMFIIGFNYFMRSLTTEIYYWIPILRNYSIHWTVSFVMTVFGCICGILFINCIKKICRRN